MANLTLHPLWHTFMPAYQRSVGVCTHALSAMALYLMITKTPPPARPFVKHLMLLQATITLVDLNYGLLVCPIVLFPVPGQLCYGILCTWFGASPHLASLSLYSATSLVAAAVIYCFHHKHATIANMTGQNSRWTRHTIAFRLAVLMVCAAPCALGAGRYRNVAGGPAFVKRHFPTLYYLFENEEYHALAYDLALFPEYGLVHILSAIFMMLFAIVVVAYFTLSTFYRLSLQSSLSERTARMQHNMMRLLIVQTITPFIIQLTPLMVCAYSITTVSLDPNINNSLMCLQLTHAFFHTAIVILTTQSYREPFVFWRNNKNENVVGITKTSSARTLH